METEASPTTDFAETDGVSIERDELVNRCSLVPSDISNFSDSCWIRLCGSIIMLDGRGLSDDDQKLIRKLFKPYREVGRDLN